MNRFLADALGIVNAISAVVTIGLGAAFGYFSTSYFAPLLNVVPNDKAHFAGFLIGAFVGFMSAVMTNGVLALLISMHAELKRLH